MRELVCVRDNMRNRPFLLLSIFSLFFLLNHKPYVRHLVMISFSQGVQSHILNLAAFPSRIYPLSAHSFTLLSPPLSSFYYLRHTNPLFHPSFSNPFRWKLYSLVLTMTHSSRLPPYPIYSAQCPRRFAPCVSSVTPLFPSIHPSSRHFQEMTTSLSSPSGPHCCSFASFHLSFSLWAASQPESYCTEVCMYFRLEEEQCVSVCRTNEWDRWRRVNLERRFQGRETSRRT